MRSDRFTLIADDLTGACEIAAVGHSAGLPAVVSMDLYAAPEEGAVFVFDTETRLDAPAVAHRKLADLARQHERALAATRVFKKVDSVMRGPIAAELDALRNALGVKRTILVPANPSLGRVIEAGTYLIDGIPLNQTPFHEDPHHPANSSKVLQLYGPAQDAMVHSAHPDGSIPDAGIIIGDAGSLQDLDKWANHCREDRLIAGSSVFFQAILAEHSQPQPETPPFITGKQLLISGTLHPDQQTTIEVLQQRGASEVSIPADNLDSNSAGNFANMALQGMQASDTCIIHMAKGPAIPGKSGLVRDTLASLCHMVCRSERIRHVIVEGGATAAAIADEMNWHRLKVVHAWSGGVVSLQPESHPHVLFTLKPGSYPWPASLLQQILHQH